MSIDENRPLLGEDKKQNETWEKVKNSVTHVAKHAHAPSEAAAIYQQWGGSDLLVLLGHAALKNISNDTNNSRGHLIKSGFADIGQAVIGFLLVLQAYSLSQTLPLLVLQQLHQCILVQQRKLIYQLFLLNLQMIF
ncbi:hypothetical protein [Spiroplasma sp. AdecLV25b]|uniref:hypothetical protein n=1 Tax=Spiroplasma sp. AdecLV25b TaxID=3027162 RepID=UPI0027E0BE0B|nr:hypothetical protein [Spiroplasma sp. AdecLV25b]